MKLVINKNVEVHGLTEAEKKELRKSLSFVNPQWVEAEKFGRSLYGIPKRIKLYEEVGGVIIAPRGSIIKILRVCGKPDEIVDETAFFTPRKIPSSIELRPVQVPWVERMLKFNQGTGVAPAGSGKTVMALHMIAALGQPTLWLTHRKSLVRQFIERAGLFLRAGEIGVIGGGKEKIGDILTVGTIQTIARRDMSQYEHSFGTVVVDEAHIIPAKQASASVRKFAPKYIYGLTATPYREDKLDQIIFDTVGPVIADMEREKVVEGRSIMPAIINVRTTDIKYAIPFGVQTTFGEIIEYLVNNKTRNNMIVGDVLGEVALGNICIVLTSRIEHGIILKEMMESLGIKCAHSHSKLTDKQRDIQMNSFLSGEVKVMIATYQLLGEGFDHKPTNRIFFALPYKARALIEQSKGRIERVFEGKSNAVVYDYVDDIPMLRRQFEQRMGYYTNHKLKVVLNKLP